MPFAWGCREKVQPEIRTLGMERALQSNMQLQTGSGQDKCSSQPRALQRGSSLSHTSTVSSGTQGL